MDESQIFESHAKTFSFAAKVLPHETYKKATTLYAFCRYCDDLADQALTAEQKLMAHERLDFVANQLRQKRSDVPLIQGVMTLIEFDKLPLIAALNLIKGIQSDLTLVRIADQQSLLDYAYHVAGTVGEMMCPILGVSDDKAIQYGIDLGIAMQLTNIARDVMEDGALNRLYLPIAWLGFDDPGLIMNEKYRPVTQNAIQKTLQLAEEYYQSASQGLSFIPFRSRISIIIALRLYRHIGIKIANQKYTYWDKRFTSSKWEKIKIGSVSVANCFLGKYNHAYQQL